MIYREIKSRGDDRTSAAYRLAAIIDRMATTDDVDTLVEFEQLAEEHYAEFGQYADRILDRINDLQSSLTAIHDEQTRLRDLAQMRQTRADRLREALRRYMEQCNLSELFTDLHTVKLKRNPPAVEVQHEAIVPAEYRRVEMVEKTSIDKKAIAEALKMGIPVDGCALIQRTRLEVI